MDRQKKFHPLMYACVTNETTDDYKFVFDAIKNAVENFLGSKFKPTTLVADGADAIRNPFYASFNETAELDIMCWAHVDRNIRKRSLNSKTNKPLIKEDLRLIQTAPTKAIFEMMATLFCEKWSTVEKEFIEYFKTQWMGVHCNWYEGVAEFTPSTNNALESHNSVIKRKVTLRRRLPLNQFLVAMKEMTEGFSNQFSDGRRTIAKEPNIVRKMMQDAALMCQNTLLTKKRERGRVAKAKSALQMQ